MERKIERMAANVNLHKAKDAKNDEFYTQFTDVERELMHYKAHFNGKIVFIWQTSGNTRTCCSHTILYDELHYIQHSEDKGGCGIINGKRMYSLIREKAGA